MYEPSTSVCYSQYWGRNLAQLVEALYLTIRGRGFNSRWGHYNFSSSPIRIQKPYDRLCLSQKLVQWDFLGSKDSRCFRLRTIPLSCAFCLKMLAASTSLSPRGLPRPVKGKLCLLLSVSLQQCSIPSYHRRYVSLTNDRILNWHKITRTYNHA